MKADRPFPWVCPKCGTTTVHEAIVSYSTVAYRYIETAQGKMRLYKDPLLPDGKTLLGYRGVEIDIPQLKAAKCTTCDEVVLSRSSCLQISEAIASHKGFKMPEGFRLKITSAELKEHCITRAAYHRKRADEKTAGLPELRKSLEILKSSTPATSVSNMNKGGYHLNTDDAVESLERDIAEHNNKSLVFAFFSEHLFDDDYVLKEDDLIKLEIVKR